MLFDAREQIERLKAVDSELFEKVIVRVQFLERNLKMFRCQPQDFVGRILKCRHC
jgi:hypothetical protein